MKLIQKIIGIFFLACLSAGATDVLVDANNFGANPATGRTVTYQVLQPFPSNLFTNVTDDNGQFTISNAKVADYAMSIRASGGAGAINFQFTVTASNLGTVNASDITSQLGVQTYPTAGKSSWTIDTMEKRYQLSGTTLSNTFYPLFSNPSNYVSWTVASNLSLAISIAYSNSLYSDYNTKIAVQSALSITNVFATNAAGVSFVNGRAYISTNYDGPGAALAIGLSGTNYVNSVSNLLAASILVNSNAMTNLVGITSNSLASAIGSAGVSALTATNIASNQVWGATNTISVTSGASAFVSTNRFETSGASLRKVDMNNGTATNLTVVSSAISFDVGALTIRLSNAAPDGMPLSMHSSTNAETVSGMHLQTYQTNAIAGAKGTDFGLWSDGFGPPYTGSAGIDLYNTNVVNSANGSFLPPNFFISVSDFQDGQVISHPIVFLNGTNLDFSLNYKSNGSRTVYPGFLWNPYVGVMPFRNSSTNLTGLGTVSGSGTSVTGSGTLFGDGPFSQMGFGDTLVVGVTAYPIRSVASKTSATVLAHGIGSPFSGSSYSVYKAPVTYYNINGVPVAAIGSDGVPVIKRGGDGAWLRLVGNTKDYEVFEGASGEYLIYNVNDNVIGMTLTPAGDVTFTGAINGLGSGLTGIPAAGISTNGSAPNYVLTSIGGQTVWTNVTAVSGAGLTNAIGTNYPNGLVLNQTLFYPTNDPSIASNFLATAIASTSNRLQTFKADTNTPTIYFPNILGGNFNTITNNNNLYFFNGGGGYIGDQTIISLAISPGNHGLLSVLGNLSATNATFFGKISGNGWGITNATATNFGTIGLTIISNIAAGAVSATAGITNAIGTNFPNGALANQTLFYPTNFVLPTNGFSTGQQATNLDILGDVAFGSTGQATNIDAGNGTNYLYFVGAGSSLTTNGALLWTSSLNCYTNWGNGSILTNNGTAWLFQTNGVSLYSKAGSNPMGAYSAVSGAAPAPAAYPTVALLDHFIYKGYFSVSNLNQLLTNANNFALASGTNYITTLGGLGTNTYLTNASLNWWTVGAALNFQFAKFGISPSVTGSGFGASVLGGSTNSITLNGGAVIAGGLFNTIAGSGGNADIIMGGAYNILNGGAGISGIDGNIIGGGYSNRINSVSTFSAIQSGRNNLIDGGGYSVIIGGVGNTNSQDGAVTLGGATNKNNGHWGLVGGRNVIVNHDNVFSWSDGTVDASVTNSQHRISATNGFFMNGPIWVNGLNTNSGIYYLSNQFSLFAVTNSMPNFAHWTGTSNGSLVHIYNSNGVPVMTIIP